MQVHEPIAPGIHQVNVEKDSNGDVVAYENGIKIFTLHRADKSKKKALRKMAKASRKINRKK